MSVSNIPLDIPQGTSFTRMLTIQDENGATVDLTGYAFAAQIRKNYTSSTITASFTFTIQDQVTNKGQVKMDLGATALNALSLSATVAYVYDVEMTLPDTTVKRLFMGNVTITPQVTA